MSRIYQRNLKGQIRCLDFLHHVHVMPGIIYSQDRALAISASMQPPVDGLSRVMLPDDGRFIDVLGQKLREGGGQKEISFRMSTFDYL